MRVALILGLGVSGRSLVSTLQQRGWRVDVVDDRPTDSTREFAAGAGVVLHEAPNPAQLAELAAKSELVVVSPGVPPRHPVFRLPGVEPISEIELGSRWVTIPMVAVTGTNGKTTVVTMVAAMLEASHRRSLTAGNIGLPLVEAAGQEADVLVVEVSSFQLALSYSFHPSVAVWLNFAPDHLDWHPDLDHYAASKARIWARQGSGDTVVLNATDRIVMAAASGVPAGVRQVTFGRPDSDYRCDSGYLVGPDGPIVVVSEMPRSLPHDVENALAATAAAVSAGADLDACRTVLRSFGALPHRVEFVADIGGVGFYDDSKATTPASVLAALAGFDSVVLLAGGQNKGLDLGALRAGADRLRAVVAIGDAAAEVEAALGDLAPVSRATSMAAAVDSAAASARPGDVVLLSPGCTSFDWYRSYAERGDDFARCVKQLGERR
ncbi:MAG TPA: UDP-N-acetylmuramoyl-L-alanine--D-glutamate ligase [Acidimicrobiales bacterium]|nr:UDP-N-acetylmuramoyl-L-alanine--D-glutamate ligase [Acidimicrobiales bacterium]